MFISRKKQKVKNMKQLKKVLFRGAIKALKENGHTTSEAFGFAFSKEKNKESIKILKELEEEFKKVEKDNERR